MAGPEFAEWFRRGRAHQAEGRPVEAQACYARAMRLAPAAADVRFRLGEVLWQLGRLPDAVAAWEEAARLAPRHPAPTLALAEAHLGLGDLAAAHEAGQRAFELAPAEPRAAGIAALTTAMRARDAGDDAAAVTRPGRGSPKRWSDRPRCSRFRRSAACWRAPSTAKAGRRWRARCARACAAWRWA